MLLFKIVSDALTSVFKCGVTDNGNKPKLSLLQMLGLTNW